MKIRKTISILLGVIMALSLVACNKGADNKKEEWLKAYNMDSMVSILQKKLDIGKEDIHDFTLDGTTGYPACEGLSVKYDDARINAYSLDDVAEAEKLFDKSYTQYKETFNLAGLFKGNSLDEKKDNYGYIIVNGTDCGCSVFGDRHATGPVYAAICYSDNMYLTIMNDTDDGIKDVEKVIKALGYPCAKNKAEK